MPSRLGNLAAAQNLIQRAEQHLHSAEIALGWNCQQSAQRELLACDKTTFQPNPIFSDTPLVTAAVIFGILSASVSVSQGLLGSNLMEHIPFQKLAAFNIWMRPLVGAVAALAALAPLSADVFREKPNPAVVLAVAFTAGYERFIIGAIDRLARMTGKMSVARPSRGAVKWVTRKPKGKPHGHLEEP